MSSARFAPQVPLPTVAFVPGRAGSKRPADGWLKVDARTLPPDRWRENEAWLHGVDLWNAGFLWEAHEAWETIWRIPYDAEQAEFLRGMIQCAAAGLKLAIGNGSSATNLARASLDRIGRIEPLATGRFMGLDLRTFVLGFHAFVDARGPADVSPPVLELS
jgi:hypothetical protein